MARSGDVETGKASRKRIGLPESGVKERAKKKARPTEIISKLTRKRASSETEYLDEDQDSILRPSRKISRAKEQSLSTVREESTVQGPDLSQRKWKRTLKAATCGDQKDENKSAVEGMESEGAGVDQKAHRKRREAKKEDESPPIRLAKKLRIDDTRAEASLRVTTNTWKRQKRQENVGSAASADDMVVSISEAWKRLREKDAENGSGSSVNGRSDSSDLSMHSIPEQHRSKKARHVSPLRQPVEKKWKRKMREKSKQSSSGKRQRDGSNGLDQSSGSSGSDMAQSSYLHNRRWKRPRYENLMSAQGRSLRKQSEE